MSVFERDDTKEDATSLIDRKWEAVQVKVFTSWMNSVLSVLSLQVVDISKDIDGVILCHFVQELTAKKIKGRWNKHPKNPMQKRENLTMALEHISEHVRLVGVGSEDFEKKNKKMILGFLWTCYKHFQLEAKLKAAGSTGKSMEEGLLAWAAKTCEPRQVPVVNYRTSFADGKAFLALVDAYVEGDKSKCAYEELIGDSSLSNSDLLETAFKLASEHMAIPPLLDAVEVAEKDCDERTLVLYTSLFFQAFVAKESALSAGERQRRQEEEAARLQQEATAGAQSASQLRERNEQLERENEELRDRLAKLESHEIELSGELGELQGELSSLREEAKLERERAAVELRGLAVLKENLLQHIADLRRWEGFLFPAAGATVVLAADTVRSDVLAQVSDVAGDNADAQLRELSTRLASENGILESNLKLVEADRAASQAKAKPKTDAKASAAKGSEKTETKKDTKAGTEAKKDRKGKSTKA